MNKKEALKSIDRIHGWIQEISKENLVENPFLISAVGFALAEIDTLREMILEGNDDT